MTARRSESWGPFNHGSFNDWFWKAPGLWTESKRWAFTNAAGFGPYQDEHFPPTVRLYADFRHQRRGKHDLWIDPDWIRWLDEQEIIALGLLGKRYKNPAPAPWTGGHQPIPKVNPMEIEKRKLPSMRQRRGQFIRSLMALKPGEVARLTTAREGRSLAGIAGRIMKTTGKTIHTAYDGDDVLAWLEDK